MDITKSLVESILKNWRSYKWSLQGFGMLRLYIEDELRLHIWDSRYQIRNVSIVHNHPWSFESHIIAGTIWNYEYEFNEAQPDNKFSEPYYLEKIITGEKARAVETNKVKYGYLSHIDMEPQEYSEGDNYYQRKDILHKTVYADGTVTLIAREDRDPESHAYSGWPGFLGRHGWISAAPCDATSEQVKSIVENSLSRWF